MKKILLGLILVLMATIMMPADSYAQTTIKRGWKKSVAGFDLPTFGKIKYDEDGYMEGSSGINYGLGYSAKTFFKPAKVGAWNPYWQWGTVLLILPYVGIGTEYIWPSGWFFNVRTIYLAPFIGFGKYI